MESEAQQEIDSISAKYEKSWNIGIGTNVVDDSGQLIGGITNPSENWMFSKPFYLSAEYYINNKFSISAMLLTNKYTEGKLYNENHITGEGADFLAIDLAVKYSIRNIVGSPNIDPYGFIGFGYSSIGDLDVFSNENEETIINIDSTERINYNIGLGINYWFSSHWGLNLNLIAKIGLNKGSYKQYTLGLVYFLN